MVIHVGIDVYNGKLSYYNETEKKTVTLQITTKVGPDEIEKVNLMFKEIKAKINEEFGFLCIYVYDYYGNKIRKKFIEEGFKIGFKNVEIINLETARYLNAMSQSKYKPLNGNIIWIKWYGSFSVWKIIDKKANFIGKWKANSSKLNDLQKIVDESKMEKGPDIVFYWENIDGTNFRKISADCKFFAINDDYYWVSNAILLKARITSGDSDLFHLNFEHFLSNKIILYIGDKEIKSFPIFQKLPIISSQKIKKEYKNDYLEILCDYRENDVIKLPDEENIIINFQIDTNEIYSVDFNHLNSKEYDSKNESKAAVIDSDNCFVIPKKSILSDTNLLAIGIDLGTSRCCAAVNRKDGIQAMPLDNTGERLLPSYISYDERHVKCGRVVVNRLRNYSKSTIFDSKRILGRKFNDIEIDENWNFTVFPENGNVFMQISGFDGKKQKLTAEKVASDLLKYIKQKAEEFQGKTISKVVITVPATFTEAQKAATISAANLAGWNEIKLLPEPIAAAFAYFIDRSIPNDSTVLLFDLGGGTLDVCIFKVQNDMIKILSNTGDSKLGGRNFDTVLINYFKNILNANFGIFNLKDKNYVLMSECQNIKEDLTVLSNISLDVDIFDPAQDGRIEITREEFQEMTQPLLNKIRNTIKAALFESNLKENQINQVLHVGGGSRMPMIKKLLKEMFPESKHCVEQHPDEVVAIGAAYFAYKIFSE